MGNCNECKWVNITEEEQGDKTKAHVCLKHRIRVLHRSNIPGIYHNFLYPCGKCNGEDFEQR